MDRNRVGVPQMLISLMVVLAFLSLQVPATAQPVTQPAEPAATTGDGSVAEPPVSASPEELGQSVQSALTGPAQAPVQPAYPAWVSDRYPPWALDYMDGHPTVKSALSIHALFAKPIELLSALLFVGLLFSGLVRRAAEAASGAKPGGSAPDARQAAKVSARWMIPVWAAAFLVACEVTGIRWVGDLLRAVGPVVGALATGIAWVLVAGLAALFLGTKDRDLALSLIGWYYARRLMKGKGGDPEVDLGGGRRARIDAVDCLHTTFRIEDGTHEIRPNAWLMKTRYNWGTTDSTHIPEPSPPERVSPIPPPPE